jgi:hypothetical protein
LIHLLLHFLVPALVATAFFRNRWKSAYLVMLATMVVDLDHLLANPIYDPGRCSIGFHPLHQPAFILIYAALCLFPKTRIIGIGLVLHMALDAIDCQVTNGLWINQSFWGS